MLLTSEMPLLSVANTQCFSGSGMCTTRCVIKWHQAVQSKRTNETDFFLKWNKGKSRAIVDIWRIVDGVFFLRILKWLDAIFFGLAKGVNKLFDLFC